MRGERECLTGQPMTQAFGGDVVVMAGDGLFHASDEAVAIAAGRGW